MIASPFVKTETQLVQSDEQLLGAALMPVKVDLLVAVALFLLFDPPLIVDAVSVPTASIEAVYVVAHRQFL